MYTVWWLSLGSGLSPKHLCRGLCKGEDYKRYVLLNILECFEGEQHNCVTILIELSRTKQREKHSLHLVAMLQGSLTPGGFSCGRRCCPEET